MKRSGGSVTRRVAASVVGAALGAGAFGLVGWHSGQEVLGASAGAVLGGALGFGAAAGLVGPITLGAVILGVFFCMIGPACDDYACNSAVPAALVGAFAGWLVQRARRADA